MGKTLLGEVMCVQQRGGGLTSWTEACWKRGIRGLVLGMSMWICRERRREKKKTNTEATGRLAQIWASQTVTQMQREQQLVDWCPWLKEDGGFTGLKWIAAVALRVCVCMHVNLSLWLHVTASAFVCVVVRWRPRLHHFRVSTLQINNATGRQIHQKGVRLMQDSCWSQAH